MPNYSVLLPSDRVPLFLSKLTFDFSNKKFTFTLLTDVLNMLNYLHINESSERFHSFLPARGVAA